MFQKLGNFKSLINLHGVTKYRSKSANAEKGVKNEYYSN